MKANMNYNNKNDVRINATRTGKSHRAHKKSVNKMKKMFFLLITVVIVMVGISFNSMTAKADNADHANEVKMYKNYCVQPGDNLWDISEKFVDLDHYESTKEFAKEVQSLNEINDVYRLTNGTYIMIPYYGTVN